MHNLTEILNSLKIQYKRVGSVLPDTFSSIAPLAIMQKDTLVFFNKPDDNTVTVLQKARNVVVLLEAKWGEQNIDAIRDSEASIFLVGNPRLVVARLLSWVNPNEDPWDEGIHPTATVHDDADIHPSVSIGRHAIIGKCVIGENSRVGSFSVIKDGAVIGKNVVIREFCHIGGCGFGIVRDESNNQLVRFPHVGGVIVGDDVELFPYVNVDRGALGNTVIKRGTKVDHYSHIGHNCIVGENTIMTARTVMCGGSSVGENSWVGVGAIIKEKVRVGNHVTVGLGAVVIRNVEDDLVVAGVPAKPMKRSDE